MSRSNPTAHGSHPCVRWHEWSGETGVIRYFDRDKKENIAVPGDFTFILLDKLAVIKGWHDASSSGITSNEVRDTTMEPFVVKAHNGPVLASGIYQQIRDRVNAQGAHFTMNLYIAFKYGAELAIGSLQIKGSALKAWMDFEKKNRSLLYSKAIRISGYDEGKKGRITYRTPRFFITDLSPESDQRAKDLDVTLQDYLSKYLARPKREQADQQAQPEPEPAEPQPDAPPDDWQPGETSADDVPF